MFIRRTIAAMLTASVLSVLSITPTHASRPMRPPPTSPGPGVERPLTAEEQAASDRKVAEALAYIAAQSASGADLVTLSCIAPDDTATSPATDGTATGGETTQACLVPQAYLPVAARDQVHGHYCGPAVGQVISNYAWAISATGNKYTQTTIAGWMSTDAKGYTNAPELAYGLERATAGAPRRPSTWQWVVTRLLDYDGDGVLGDELQNFVRSSVSGSKMPLAIPVKPYDPKGSYHLSSWKKPVNSPGHWVAAFGWYSLWAGNDFSRIYYTDSSRDEGGSTGKYWDPTRHIAEMIRVHTGRFVW